MPFLSIGFTNYQF